jgi:TetR/AcrR family transcriptional regulator, transcriptional repressor for nem operon
VTRYSTQHKEETRARILAASERLMKVRGVAQATVDEVMREAGLTVGGFYAHFASKEALAHETLLAGVERSFEMLTAGLESLDDEAFVRALIARYLEQADDQELADACPLTLLLPDVARAGDTFRAEFSARTSALMDRIAHRFPGVDARARRDAALATFAALAGAIEFARAAVSQRARRRIADATQRMLLAGLGLTGHARDKPRNVTAKRSQPR